MRNPDRQTVFRFKRFEVVNSSSAMKVGTDAVLLGAWCSAPCDGMPVLDVGCGCGVISLILAQRFPAAQVCGIEIDRDAADEAEANFAASPWPDRLRVLCGDFREAFSAAELSGGNSSSDADDGGGFGLIVSNPPFFTNGELPPDETRMIARHENSLPLELLVSRSRDLLCDGGILAVVLPADREEELLQLGLRYGMPAVRLTRVTTVQRKPPRRILAELRKLPSLAPGGVPCAADTCVEDSLVIHSPDGGFTPEYTALVKDFYLKM